jgi:hypothetical protein
MKLGSPAGRGATGGGYLHTTVMTSSPSISRPGWKRTTMLLVNTRVGSYKNTTISDGKHSHGEGCQWWGCHRGRVATHDGDYLVSIHLKSRMEPDHYVVREHPLRILLKQSTVSVHSSQEITESRPLLAAPRRVRGVTQRRFQHREYIVSDGKQNLK